MEKKGRQGGRSQRPPPLRAPQSPVYTRKCDQFFSAKEKRKNFKEQKKGQSDCAQQSKVASCPNCPVS